MVQTPDCKWLTLIKMEYSKQKEQRIHWTHNTNGEMNDKAILIQHMGSFMGTILVVCILNKLIDQYTISIQKIFKVQQATVLSLVLTLSK